jgi:2-desacetyl-2-hydroxyethyl bacteriochlorophyllide A dehydrogenase
MKYVVFEDVGKLEIKEKPVPKVEDDKVLIKVKMCGLCGTDSLIYLGLFPADFPYSPGHEYSGEVVDIGSRVKRIKVNDRVAVNPNCECEECYYCLKGLPHLCENLKRSGIKSNGGLAEYCLVSEKIVYPIPKNISFKEAALIEPLSCCLHVLDEANIQAGDTIAIIGGGTMGLISLELCKNAGAKKIVLSEPIEEKRNIAKKLGATEVSSPTKENLSSLVKNLSPHGADIVIDNVGRPETIKEAFKSLRRKGKLILPGLVLKESVLPISPFEITKNEIEIKGVFLNPNTFSRAIDVIAAKQINTRALITHEFALDDIAQALETARKGEAIKVVVKIDNK